MKGKLTSKQWLLILFFIEHTAYPGHESKKWAADALELEMSSP
jgi:hypothetical protein